MTEEVICCCDEHSGHGNKTGIKNLKFSSPGFKPMPVIKTEKNKINLFQSISILATSHNPFTGLQKYSKIQVTLSQSNILS
jgi:hypothetical protein